MKGTASRMIPLDENLLWQADKRLLPSYLCTSDNTRRIEYYKRALRIAIKTQLTDTQREQLRLFYGKHLTKTEIGRRYGVGSSTICKTLNAAETVIRKYVELFMHIYDLIQREQPDEDDEYGELLGG